MTPKQRTDRAGRWLPPGVEHHHGHYRLRRMVAGVVTRTPLGTTYRDMLREWADLTGEDEPGTTIGQAMTRYLAENPGELRERTMADYTRYADVLRPVFGHVRLDALPSSAVAQYLDRRSAKTAGNREIAFLSSVFAAAMRWGWCERNPCRGVRRTKESPTRRTPTDAELAALRAAADPQMRCIIDLAVLTGLRLGDVLRLRLADWSDAGLRVETSKTGASVLYQATPALVEVMGRTRALRRRVGSLYLFAGRKGQPYTTSGLQSMWRRLQARAGVRVPFHGLRRYAAQQAEARQGRAAAQALLTHSTEATTAKYLEAKVREVTPWE